MKWPVQSLKVEQQKSVERRRSIVKQVSPHKALSSIDSERPTSNNFKSSEMSGLIDISDQRAAASRNDIRIVFDSNKTPTKQKNVTGEKNSPSPADLKVDATLEPPIKDSTQRVSINRNSETIAIATKNEKQQ